MKIKDLIDNNIYVASNPINPEFSSIFRFKSPNYCINRLYLRNPKFEFTENSQFSDDCIKRYKWEFHIPTKNQIKWLISCEKANRFVPCPKTIDISKLHIY